MCAAICDVFYFKSKAKRVELSLKNKLYLTIISNHEQALPLKVS